MLYLILLEKYSRLDICLVWGDDEYMHNFGGKSSWKAASRKNKKEMGYGSTMDVRKIVCEDGSEDRVQWWAYISGAGALDPAARECYLKLRVQ